MIFEPYLISIILGTILFVIGQYFLRKSFDNDVDYKMTWIIFCMTLGLIAFVMCCILLVFDKSMNFKNKNEKVFNSILAGLCFVIGNLFWIYSISTKKSIGVIRTIMAGTETFLLFLLGFFLFSEKFTYIKILGILLILTGIYLIK